MKIFVNTDIVNGPWGGGNLAIKGIITYLVSKGHVVTTSLKSADIDLIFMIHPVKYLNIRKYGIDEIIDYITLHPKTILVHRINTSGEFHRGTGNETKILLEANKNADFTVFISSFLKNLYVQKGFDINRPHRIILNGADESIFNPEGSEQWQEGKKIKIVTHHWSSNYMKGFDIYERLDLLLGTKPYNELFEFTFIGNVPQGLQFKNARVLQPISGVELANTIKQHHIYITASRNEGAGMHHIEGMRCGLPVLFLNSGALPEYCSPYGVEFNLVNFEQKLIEIKERYFELRKQVLNCPYSSTWMATQYEELFKELVYRRSNQNISEPNMLKKIHHKMLVRTYNKLKKVNQLIKKGKEFLTR